MTLAPVAFGGQWRTPVSAWEGAHYRQITPGG